VNLLPAALVDRAGDDPSLGASGDLRHAVGQWAGDLFRDPLLPVRGSTGREPVDGGQVELGEDHQVDVRERSPSDADVVLELVERGRWIPRDGRHLGGENGKDPAHAVEPYRRRAPVV
jgi:hypothetical protein